MEIGKQVIGPLIEDSNLYKHRQPIIKRVQENLNAKLIVYTSSPSHPFPSIMIQDVPLFEDLLRSVSGVEEGYLMINCPGGDPNAAEKLLMMCRERFTKSFSVIVPDYAKSAATMIALGSDKILMGYLAELGPIDPQLRMAPPPLPGETIPARSFVDGLEIIRRRIKEDGDPFQMYLPMIARIRPEVLAMCQRAIDDARATAEKWLKKYMLKHDPNQAEKVAEWLSAGEKYKSHGKVINFDEVKNVLKLNVEKIDKDSDLWKDVWELYCRSILFLQKRPNAAKLFESESASLTMSIKVVRAPPPRVARRPSPPPPPPKTPEKKGS